VAEEPALPENKKGAMIIVNDKPGHLCNRVWAFSYFVAYALEHNVTIYLPNFREYQSYFEDLTSILRLSGNFVRSTLCCFTSAVFS